MTAAPRMTFNLEIFKGEDGYFIARWKEFPGVASQGRDEREARENAIEALMAALEALAQETTASSEPISRGRRIQTTKFDLVPA